jgi:hypothetical protein
MPKFLAYIRLSDAGMGLETRELGDVAAIEVF